MSVRIKAFFVNFGTTRCPASVRVSVRVRAFIFSIITEPRAVPFSSVCPSGYVFVFPVNHGSPLCPSPAFLFVSSESRALPAGVRPVTACVGPGLPGARGRPGRSEEPRPGRAPPATWLSGRAAAARGARSQPGDARPFPAPRGRLCRYRVRAAAGAGSPRKRDFCATNEDRGRGRRVRSERGEGPSPAPGGGKAAARRGFSLKVLVTDGSEPAAAGLPERSVTDPHPPRGRCLRFKAGAAGGTDLVLSAARTPRPGPVPGSLCAAPGKGAGARLSLPPQRFAELALPLTPGAEGPVPGSDLARPGAPSARLGRCARRGFAGPPRAGPGLCLPPGHGSVER